MADILSEEEVEALLAATQDDMEPIEWSAPTWEKRPGILAAVCRGLSHIIDFVQGYGWVRLEESSTNG